MPGSAGTRRTAPVVRTLAPRTADGGSRHRPPGGGVQMVSSPRSLLAGEMSSTVNWVGAGAWLSEHAVELILGAAVVWLGVQANRGARAASRLALLQATPVVFPSTVEVRYVLDKPRATVFSTTVTNLGGVQAAVGSCRLVSGRTAFNLRSVEVVQPNDHTQRKGMNPWQDARPVDPPTVDGGRATRLHFMYDAPAHDPERIEDRLGNEPFTFAPEVVGGPSPSVEMQVTGPGTSRQKTIPASDDSPYLLAQRWHESLLPPTLMARALKRIGMFRQRLHSHREFRRYLDARRMAGFKDPPPPSWWSVIRGRR